MDRTPNLDLPYLAPAQAQKHVTVNDALRALDSLVRTRVKSAVLNAPPAQPGEGEIYLVPAGGDQSWGAPAGWLAAFQDGAWRRFEPQSGWLIYLEEGGHFLHHDGADWTPLLSSTPEFDQLGVNAAPSQTNRLAVCAAGALFTHDGGDHRLSINKAGASDTASLVFQTGFSGRAEFGLAGQEDFGVKLSPDGVNWSTALGIRNSGGVDHGWVAIGHDAPARALHVRGDTAGLRLQESATGFLDIINTQPSQSQINQSSESGPALLDFNPLAMDGVGNAMFRCFRGTQTTGEVRFDIHVGDGTPAANARISGNTHSFLNALHGHVGIGTQAPKVLLDVAGPVRVGAYTLGTLPPTWPEGQIIYVSDAAGGPALAVSTGGEWRHCSSGTTLS